MGQSCSKCYNVFCKDDKTEVAEEWIKKNGTLYGNDQLPNKVQEGFEWVVTAFSAFHFVIAIGIIIFGIYTLSLREEISQGSKRMASDQFIYQMSLIPNYLIAVGCVVTVVSLVGLAGVLRHHLPLMIGYLVVLFLYSLAQIILACLALTMKSRIEASIYSYFSSDALVNYREDIDLQNLIDFFQIKYKCCGASDDYGYLDWTKNAYFRCTTGNPSIERCSVPYSCCIDPTDVNTGMARNIYCGFGAQTKKPEVAGTYIYTGGCIDAVFDSLQAYSGAVVAAICALIIIPIVLEILMVLLIRDVMEEKRAYKNWEQAMARGDKKAEAALEKVEEENAIELGPINSSA